MTLAQEGGSYKILRDIKIGITESNYIGMNDSELLMAVFQIEKGCSSTGAHQRFEKMEERFSSGTLNM
jgi:hypothetical protein